MRHLVVCGQGTKEKHVQQPVRLARPRRTGQDHTVLLTVVGNPSAASSTEIQNPDLIPGEDSMIVNFVSNEMPCEMPFELPCEISHVMPPEMTHVMPPEMTHVMPPEMTHVMPPEMTHVIPPEMTHVMPPPVMPHEMAHVMPPPLMQHVMPPPVMQHVMPPPVMQHIMPPPIMPHVMPPPVMSHELTNIPEPKVDDGMNRIGSMSDAILREAATSPDYWHKFTVHRGAGYTKLEIMYALVNAMLAPVMYRREGSDITFFARNCLAGLLKLINTQMQLQVQADPLGSSVHKLDVEITLYHTNVQDLKFNLHDYLSACIAKRHDKTLQMLDLSAFHQAPELSEVFWALWTPNAFIHVLGMLTPMIAEIRCLCLTHNELTEIPHMGVLCNLETVDLSSNKIASINVLTAFTGLNILDITLDRNPVCASFNDELSYIQAIKILLPTVKKIDGVHLTRPELPLWRRHYVPPGQTECVALVEQFLQHYFTLLDGDDRQQLRGMYHPNAVFSLTCNYVPGQSTSSTARLTRYTLESRNLLRLSDISKSQQLLSQGAEEVLSALCRLPRTEHDPYTFAVDLPYYTRDIAVIVVSGVFREPSTNENLMRAFSRTFVLRKVASKEYQIANEMLTVCNASTKQAEESFRYPKPKVSLAKLSFNPAQDLTDSDRKQMTRILSHLTEMTPQWAQKCLEQTKWDIKWALEVFTELLKMNKMPAEAFLPEKDRVGAEK